MKFASIVVLLFSALAPARASRLSDALDLEAKGKLREASELLRTEIVETRASGDFKKLAPALSVQSRISVALGDYRGAIQTASEAVALRARLKTDAAMAEDYNTLGLAHLYLGDYDGALSNYSRALEIDRRQHDGEAVVTRLNNIGNISYFRGRYQDALHAYQEAMDTVSSAGSQPWVPRCRQLTVANLAALYLRVGQEQQALDLYRQLTAAPQSLTRAQYAQFLLNEGVLYRRLGDPVKALEEYRAAQALYATEHHRDGEIGALRNIGIARAIDFDDLKGAHDAFNAALHLALQSSDKRGIVQAALYRAEVLRRLGRRAEAEQDFRTALDGAQSSGLAEERWKAQYGLGRIDELEGRPAEAAGRYRDAIAGIESVRAGIQRVALRSEFLADKRDVYDSLISLLLRQPDPPLDQLFSLMERSRARTLEERSSSGSTDQLGIPDVRAALPPDTVFVEYWVGDEDVAALWISNSGAGVAHTASGSLRASMDEFLRTLEDGNDAWRRLSRDLGRQLLAGVPPAGHLISSPDGQMALLPLEALTSSGSGRLLIEDCDVSYLPAARFLRRQDKPDSGWLAPWRTQLLAFGDPPVSEDGAAQQWQPLTAAGDEIRSIAAILPGRSAVYLGAAARKRELTSRPLAGTSLLHFSTHAVVDTDNSDRSRIVMAAGSARPAIEYLYLHDVYGLNLKGVDLATISACETARGKLVRGDGVQAFSQAFLAAGAAATVSSLWRVADRPTAEFMKQFYFYLSSGLPKAQALRSAKLQFLHSTSRWNAPRYWSAFVLYGDGWNPCARVLPWSWLAAAAGTILLAAVLWTRR